MMRRAAFLCCVLLSMSTSSFARSGDSSRLTVDTVRNAFHLLTSPATAARFFDEYVSDDVLWTVMGTNYLAGTTRGKARFVSEDVVRLREFLASDIAMVIDHIHVAGDDTAIVEMRSTARLKSGAPYNMTYIWVVGFSKDHSRIERVRAYVDTEVLNRVFRENERLPNVFVTCEMETGADRWDEVGAALDGLRKHSRVAEAGLERFHVLADPQAGRYRLMAEFANDYSAARFLGSAYWKDAIETLGRLTGKEIVVAQYSDNEVQPSLAPKPASGS